MKLGYRERDGPSSEEIFAMFDDQLFSKINSNSLHILQQFMPDRPSLNYSLRASRYVLLFFICFAFYQITPAPVYTKAVNI